MPMTRPPYSSGFREQMLELVRSGRSPEELAREFEPSAQSIRNWVGQADQDVVRRAILTPQYQATSIAYRADRRATHAPNNKPRRKPMESSAGRSRDVRVYNYVQISVLYSEYSKYNAISGQYMLICP